MKARIDMVGIATSQFDEMVAFYRDTLGFPIQMQLEKYVEFENDGVRFSIGTKDVMIQTTGHDSYKEEKRGQSLGFAFRVDTPAQVDSTYDELLAKGAAPIKSAEDKPWNQRTAFFADPDGNIHEVFADITQ